jgi:outer membrane protein OmpA-like peptidoglycan-associated protein
MKKLVSQLATIGALVALIAALPGASKGEDMELQGRWFGGVNAGVMQPVKAFNNYVETGGVLSPFAGYKFFDDKDLQLNLGLVAEAQFIGAASNSCSGCVRGIGDDNVYGLGILGGPRVSLPIGPVELYGMWGAGGMWGLTSPSALSEGSWGFSTGGGINYSINDNVMVGAFGRFNQWYQQAHRVDYVRYVTTGIGVTLQQSPPAPPPPPPPVVAQAPPPPPPPMKKKIVLRGVNFDFDKSNIRPDAVPILEQACKTLKEEPNIDVSCNGYTDSIGTEKYNQGLSERRANSVRQWLVKCGIPSSRLSAKGFGESDPVATNATPEGRAQNRRTELVVTNQ